MSLAARFMSVVPLPRIGRDCASRSPGSVTLRDEAGLVRAVLL